MSPRDGTPLPPVPRPRCGSYAGVQQHYKHGEQLCHPCGDANNLYVRAARRFGRCAPGLGWPLGPYDPAPRGPVKRRPPRWAR